MTRFSARFSCRRRKPDVEEESLPGRRGEGRGDSYFRAPSPRDVEREAPAVVVGLAGGLSVLGVKFRSIHHLRTSSVYTWCAVLRGPVGRLDRDDTHTHWSSWETRPRRHTRAVARLADNNDNDNKRSTPSHHRSRVAHHAQSMHSHTNTTTTKRQGSHPPPSHSGVGLGSIRTPMARATSAPARSRSPLHAPPAEEAATLPSSSAASSPDPPPILVVLAWLLGVWQSLLRGAWLAVRGLVLALQNPEVGCWRRWM